MTTSPRPGTRTAVALCGVALLATVAAGPAAAGRATVEHVRDSVSEVFPAGEWDVCPDLAFDVHWSFEERGVILSQNRGPDGLPFWGGRFHGVESWANPETGHVFTRTFDVADRDHEVVDNGDGTLTITIQVTGPDRYALDGVRLFTDTGIGRFSVLIDHGGTPTDPADDVFLTFLGLDKLAGNFQTEGRDFCADVQEFLG